jgi:iron(III) transport system ATP-binding protein
MRVEIRRIQKTLGITAVYVTHDRIEAMSLYDMVIVMKDGEIMHMGSPKTIYEEPDSTFVAGFVGRVTFFPVEILGKAGSGWECRLGNRGFEATKAAPGVEKGRETKLMARPESLRLVDAGKGYVDGKIKMNVYLGHSIETFVETVYGETLIQIDDPLSKKIYGEGDAVSIDFAPERVRLLQD